MTFQSAHRDLKGKKRISLGIMPGSGCLPDLKGAVHDYRGG